MLKVKILLDYTNLFPPNEKTLVLSIICSKCKNAVKKIFKEE